MAIRKHLKPWVAIFKQECHDRQEDLGYGGQLDWFSVTIGWAIAKGMSPKDASDFAEHIRYHTDLG